MQPQRVGRPRRLRAPASTLGSRSARLPAVPGGPARGRHRTPRAAQLVIGGRPVGAVTDGGRRGAAGRRCPGRAAGPASRQLELQHRLVGPRSAPRPRAPGRRSTRTPWVCSTVAGPARAEQRGRGVDVVAPAQRVPRAGAAVRVGEQRGRDVEVAVDRARPAPRRPGSRPARSPRRRGAARWRAPATTSAGSSTTSSTAWQSTRSTPPGSTSAGERVAVALHGAHPVGHPRLGGPAGERGERVRAGVDDGDAVPGLGQRDGEPAGAAADVEHGERRGRPCRSQFAAQHRPDHGGTRGRRAVRLLAPAGRGRAGPVLCSLHPDEPRPPHHQTDRERAIAANVGVPRHVRRAGHRGRQQHAAHDGRVDEDRHRHADAEHLVLDGAERDEDARTRRS